MENNQIVQLVEISYNGRIATRDLIFHFRQVAENKGLEKPTEAFQAWAVSLGYYPTKNLKSGKVVPLGWQAGLKLAYDILEKEPNNVKAINYRMYTTVYNNMCSSLSSDKAKTKTKDTDTADDTDTDTEESFMVTVNAEMAELAVALHKAGSNRKATKADYQMLCAYSAEVIASIFEVDLTEATEA